MPDKNLLELKGKLFKDGLETPDRIYRMPIYLDRLMRGLANSHKVYQKTAYNVGFIIGLKEFQARLTGIELLDRKRTKLDLKRSDDSLGCRVLDLKSYEVMDLGTGRMEKNVAILEDARVMVQSLAVKLGTTHSLIYSYCLMLFILGRKDVGGEELRWDMIRDFKRFKATIDGIVKWVEMQSFEEDEGPLPTLDDIK